MIFENLNSKPVAKNEVEVIYEEDSNNCSYKHQRIISIRSESDHWEVEKYAWDNDADI